MSYHKLQLALGEKQFLPHLQTSNTVLKYGARNELVDWLPRLALARIL